MAFYTHGYLRMQGRILVSTAVHKVTSAKRKIKPFDFSTFNVNIEYIMKEYLLMNAHS